jgi:hypothetical protein
MGNASIFWLTVYFCDHYSYFSTLSSCFHGSCLQILLPERVHIDFWSTIQRRPFRLLLKQPHSHNILHSVREFPVAKRISTYILIICRKSMINSRWQNLNSSAPIAIFSRSTYNQIILLQEDPNPLITLTSHVKEARSISDISDLLIFM